MDLKFGHSWQRASGDQLNHRNPIPRGMPGGKPSGRGYRSTHVLPWKPAYFLFEKVWSFSSPHSILPPCGRMKLCCQLKKVPTVVTDTHYPPNMMQNRVCRTGTLRLCRERSDEVMQSNPMSPCRIPPPPPPAPRCQRYCPTCSSHKVQGYPGPTSRCAKHRCPQWTPTSLLHVLAFPGKMEEFALRNESAPSLPDSQRVPL